MQPLPHHLEAGTIQLNTANSTSLCKAQMERLQCGDRELWAAPGCALQTECLQHCYAPTVPWLSPDTPWSAQYSLVPALPKARPAGVRALLQTARRPVPSMAAHSTTAPCRPWLPAAVTKHMVEARGHSASQAAPCSPALSSARAQRPLGAATWMLGGCPPIQ